MKRRIVRISAATLLVLGLLFANQQMAFAHNWWIWCWHKGRTLSVRVSGSHQAEANAALNDWDYHSDVNFRRVNTHTHISVFGYNFGATRWGGLARIKKYSYDWWHHWWWCRIQHAHAMYNTYYGGSSSRTRGIFCQEIGHVLGLGHSNDGCMGYGYYWGGVRNNITYTVSHNWRDINRKF